MKFTSSILLLTWLTFLFVVSCSSSKGKVNPGTTSENSTVSTNNSSNRPILEAETPTSIRIVGIEARFVSLSDGTLGPDSINNGGKPYTDSILFNVIVSDKRTVPMEIFDLVLSIATKRNGKIFFNDNIKQFRTIGNERAYFPFLSRLIGDCDDFQLTAKLINSETKKIHQIFQKEMPFDCGD